MLDKKIASTTSAGTLLKSHTPSPSRSVGGCVVVWLCGWETSTHAENNVVGGRETLPSSAADATSMRMMALSRCRKKRGEVTSAIAGIYIWRGVGQGRGTMGAG